MSINRSTFFVAAGGCLFGAMIPILLGAAQSPDRQFPHYSVSGLGGTYIAIVDNQKDELHLYTMRDPNPELHITFDLNQASAKTLTSKYYKYDDLIKKREEEKKQKPAQGKPKP